MKRGFTLIEAMIVAAILAIIIAIAIPTFSDSKKKAELAPIQVGAKPIKQYEVDGQTTTYIDEVEIDGQRYLICTTYSGSAIAIIKKEVKAEK